MAPLTSLELMMCFILHLFILSTSSTIPIHKRFIQCFHHHTPNIASYNLRFLNSVDEIQTQVVYIPNTTSYNTLLLSTINNLRFLNSTRAPDLIVAPTHESEIQASVICCRKHGIQMRIRSGGHDFEGLSYHSDEGPFIMLDLKKFKSISINADQRTAWVQVGATLGELYYRISNMSQTAGFPAGLCHTVGVGGHFSGGGSGTLMRKYGLAADNIIDARLVDANGTILDRKSMGEDLFWAIRGGGGASFGVMTAFKIKLVQVPAIVTVFTVQRTLGQGVAKLVTRWQEIAPKTHYSLFINVEISPLKDEKGQGNKTILVQFQSLFLGRIKHLLPLIENSFPELRLKAKDCSEVSWIKSVVLFAGYTQHQPIDVLLSRTSPLIARFKSKYDFVTEPIPEIVWEEICEWLFEGDSDENILLQLNPFGARMGEISESETPYPHRKGNLFTINYLVNWGEGEAASDSARHMEWVRRLYRRMTPYVSKNPRAAYVNARDLDIGRNEKGKTSYSISSVWGVKYFKDNFNRLALVKGRVDPSNFFSYAQSIPPLIPM